MILQAFHIMHAIRWILSVFLAPMLVLGLSSARAQDTASIDAGRLLAAVIGLEAEVPDDARTAGTLGTRRSGSGVVIDSDGLVVTIGYLILEASSVTLTLADNREVPARIVAYDHATGFGLVRALQNLDVTPLPLGSATQLDSNDPVLVAGAGGPSAARAATVVARREFAGSWEYLLDRAIFTAPPYPRFGGAALIGPDGALLGVGSLAVGDATRGDASPGDASPGDSRLPGNMFVPIDLLEPILGEMLSQGRSGTMHPWLGLNAGEYRGHLLIDRLSKGGPAERAGLRDDDLIVAVAGQPVADLVGFYRRVWSLGDAGVEVPLTVLRSGELIDVAVSSGNRYDWLRLNPSF
jgi:S1-C subfamily serine protease